MVSFTIGAKSARWSWPLLLKVGAKLTCQHNGCNIYYNKRRDLYNKHRDHGRDLINKCLCQHADDKSLIESTMVWLERRHLAFAVANCVFNLRFAAALSDCCGVPQRFAAARRTLQRRRIAGEARNMTENALSILIVIFSAELQQTEISERKLFIFHFGLEDSIRICSKSEVYWSTIGGPGEATYLICSY